MLWFGFGWIGACLGFYIRVTYNKMEVQIKHVIMSLFLAATLGPVLILMAVVIGIPKFYNANKKKIDSYLNRTVFEVKK